LDNIKLVKVKDHFSLEIIVNKTLSGFYQGLHASS
jgi:hypothetical protein